MYMRHTVGKVSNRTRYLKILDIISSVRQDALSIKILDYTHKNLQSV